ncbi:hypothetical protein Dda_2006 [Drechslerella dactyloides]|uniref:Long-chain-alcohol oxidase n=1 Tax=Drechslerella dactyloides TaxID=74499 RepID=A0AAD6J2Q1_DREDA|nr:hypothetical protein Dda_2006 [Drechslerella dactyloides]
MVTEAMAYRFRPASEVCVFSDAQWNMLVHILETFVPELTPEETADLKKDYYKRVRINPVEEKHLDAYAQESLADVPEVLEDVESTFRSHVPAGKVAEMKMLLNILDTRLGSLVLTGSITPFYQQTRQERERIIFSWSTARTITLRKLFRAFSTTARVLWSRSSDVYHKAAAFPGYPFTKEGEELYKMIKESATAAAESAPEFRFEDLRQGGSAETGVVTLSTSILIIGSGAGGGVAAGCLSKALPHHEVVVIDKGFWYPKHAAPISERDGFQKLYEESATLQTVDGSMGILAGSTWGGGTTVNAGVSWQLSARIRREWSEKAGLKFVESSEFQDCLDYVSETGKVKEWKDLEHNPSNATLMKGSHRLGEAYIRIPQNIKGEPEFHSKGVTKTYLADARDRGARFVQGLEVEKILFDKNGDVTGVEGLWRAHPDKLKRQKVIIRANCMAEWDEEIRPWEGSMVSIANIEHTNLDNHNYGAAIEVVGAPTYIRLEDKEEDQKAFDEAVLKLQNMGLTTENAAYGSAHQMGSCRMGASPRMGACNERGKVWERKGLYIADASLMPKSSALNPMITTQALAEWVSRGIDNFDSSADSTDDDMIAEDQIEYNIGNCSPTISRLGRDINFLQDHNQEIYHDMDDDIAFAFGSSGQGDSLDFTFDEIQNDQTLFDTTVLISAESSDQPTNNSHLAISPCLLTPPLSLRRDSHEGIVGLESLGIPCGRAQTAIGLEKPRHRVPESPANCRSTSRDIEATHQAGTMAFNAAKIIP